MSTKTKRQPTRAEIPDEFKWKLDRLFPNQDAWEAEVKELEKLIQTIGDYKGRLAESAGTLLAALRLSDTISERLMRVVAYARLHRDTDTANPKFQALFGRSLDLATRFQTAQSFLEPELLAIDQDTVDRFLAENEGLRLYDQYLENLRRFVPHVLTPAEEALLAQMTEIARAPSNAFDLLNNADMRFPTIRDEQGEEVELTHGRYIGFMKSRDRRVRREAFQALYSTYEKQINTIGALLNASVKKDGLFARVRRYESTLQQSLFSDNIPVSVYDNLVDTVRSNLHHMHRYVTLRKKALGVDELHMYDLYAPLVPDVEFNIPFPEAKEMLTKALEPLGSEYVNTMRQGMDSGWLDVYESAGKISGAYSMGIYGHYPHVLLNHEDNLDGVFTLAHEMGHAMHSYYSNATQPYVYSHYTIFLAEVASTVNEALLTEYLLQTTTDRTRRMYIINHYLDRFRATVFRQTMFAEFERWMHSVSEEGQTLTPALLNEKYAELNADYHGPDMVIDDEIRLEWARIPHFYRAFYVYKYATGFTAATALSRQILDEGQPAVERYLEFLRSGCSDYSLNLLSKAGVDMSAPEPIQAGMDLFGRLVAELEELL